MYVDSKINICATKISDSLNTYFADLATTCVTTRVFNDQETRPSWQVLGSIVLACFLAIRCCVEEPRIQHCMVSLSVSAVRWGTSCQA